VHFPGGLAHEETALPRYLRGEGDKISTPALGHVEVDLLAFVELAVAVAGERAQGWIPGTST
jgi:hypothetical protein